MNPVCYSFGINGFDTLFLSMIGAFGFMFGALAMQDLDRRLKGDE